MHNSWIDSAERFSHTTFLHSQNLPVIGGTSHLEDASYCLFNRLTMHGLITPQLCARMNIRNDAHSEGESSVPLLSLLFSPVFCPFSFANIHNSCLRIYAKYMTRSNHVKGNSLMVCTCIASYVTSRALHTMSSSSTVSVVYRGKRGDITPLFRSARSRSFMFDQKRMSRAEGIYSISEKKTAEKMLCCQRLL